MAAHLLRGLRRCSGTTAHREFNFSPSGAWAAYAFSDYRKSAALPLGPVPPIAFVPAAGTLTLATTLAPGWLPKSPLLCLGLSVVVETRTASAVTGRSRIPSHSPISIIATGLRRHLEMRHEPPQIR